MTTTNIGPGALPDGGGPETGDTTRIRAVETFDSRTLQVANGKRVRRRRFLVYATEGAGTVVPSDSVALQQTGVQYGDAHPDDPGVVALDVQVRVRPETGRGCLEVVVTYRQGEVTGQQPDDPEAPDYLEVNLSGEGQFIDVFRQGAAVPMMGTPPAGRPDIGGEPVDIAGQPISLFIRVARYNITRNLLLSEFNASELLAAVGVRNDSEYLGFPAGSVLYGRPRSTRIAQGVVRVVHELLVDQDTLHLRQQAAADTEGVRLSTAVPGGEGDSHASKVYHVQPFPLLGNLASLPIVP